MLSRALSLATVTLLVGCLTAVAVHAVENLEAGKTPAQIFAGTCNVCHKSPRGLMKTVSASSLPGFLRQHYTTSSNMASLLSSYLVANGAGDQRYQAKEAKETKQRDSGTKEARAPADQGTKPRSRLQRAGEADGMRPDTPVHITNDKGKKDKKKGRSEEPEHTEPAAEPPRETAKREEDVKPAAEPKSAEPKSESAKTESARIEPAKESAGEPAATRRDPVPAVTPAPATVAAAPPSSAPGPAVESPPPVQPLDAPSKTTSEQRPALLEFPKPAAVAAAPALPPVPPAGPPTVPISR